MIEWPREHSGESIQLGELPGHVLGEGKQWVLLESFLSLRGPWLSSGWSNFRFLMSFLRLRLLNTACSQQNSLHFHRHPEVCLFSPSPRDASPSTISQRRVSFPHLPEVCLFPPSPGGAPSSLISQMPVFLSYEPPQASPKFVSSESVFDSKSSNRLFPNSNILVLKFITCCCLYFKISPVKSQNLWMY